MKCLLALLLVACGGSSDPVRAAPPPPHDLTPRERAVAQVIELVNLRDPDHATIARVLATEPHGDSVGDEYRLDTAFEPTALFETIELAEGRDWYDLRLVPAASLGLALQDLQPAVLDARYGSEPLTIHHTDGLELGGIIQHFAFGTHEVAVLIPFHPRGRTVHDATTNAIGSGIDQVSTAGRRDAIGTIDVSSKSRVPAGAPTLRVFRKWAATRP